MVPKPVRFYGRPSGMEKRVAQWDMVSLTIFNIVVDAVVRAVLM